MYGSVGRRAEKSWRATVHHGAARQGRPASSEVDKAAAIPARPASAITSEHASTWARQLQTWMHLLEYGMALLGEAYCGPSVGWLYVHAVSTMGQAPTAYRPAVLHAAAALALHKGGPRLGPERHLRTPDDDLCRVAAVLCAPSRHTHCASRRSLSPPPPKQLAQWHRFLPEPMLDLDDVDSHRLVRRRHRKPRAPVGSCSSSSPGPSEIGSQ
ncbi:hypothetical protein CDD83_7780 [Cordyceps sp. RAO-2017]|nr:hypothetical protein CDD83_7780 [Cordyceps sp. RAO-2017]